MALLVIPQPMVLVKCFQRDMGLEKYSIVLEAMPQPGLDGTVANFNPIYPDLPILLQYWYHLYHNIYVFEKVMKHELCHLLLWEQDGCKTSEDNKNHRRPFLQLAHEFEAECHCHPDREVKSFIEDRLESQHITSEVT